MINKYKHIILFAVSLILLIVIYIAVLYIPSVRMLKEKSLTEFSNEVKIRNYMINSVANRVIDGAKSMSSRTMIRKKIAEHYENKISFEELKSYTEPKYIDGINALNNCVYALRYIKSGLLIEYKTKDCKKKYLSDILDTVRQKLVIHLHHKDSMLITNVISPIWHKDEILGYDILYSKDGKAIPKAEENNYIFSIVKNDTKGQENTNYKPILSQDSVSLLIASSGSDILHKFSIAKSHLFKQVNEYETKQITFILLLIIILTLAYFAIRQGARIYYFKRGDFLEKLVAEKTNDLKNLVEELKTKNEKLYSSERQLRESNKTKDKLFSIIAHDLKGPLSGLVNLIDLFLSKDLDKSKQERYLKTAKITTQNTHNLIENLLAWARSQSNQIQYNPVELNACKMTEDTIENLNQQASHKNITITNKIDQLHTIRADKNMLLIVLRNLLSNAIKFTQIDGEINLSSSKKNNGFIEIQIRDNGVGMKPEKLKTLFHKNSSTTTLGTDKEQGTGLGLVLCKEFIGKHGGEINAESEPDKGSTFTFTIPNNS